MKRHVSQHSKRSMFVFLLIAYLIALITLAFFPRPILDTGSPSEIAIFLQEHSGVFYKILYADARVIAIANFFMLTPFIIVIRYAVPIFQTRKIFFLGISISLVIELTQILIPGRVPDFADLFSNTVSVVIGVLLIRFIQNKS